MISTTPDGYARSAVIETPATYGDNVRLTIDSKVQAAVEKALADSPKKMKAAVLLDIHTGDVVAMASQPAVDPNMYLPSMSSDEWTALNNDEFHPLLDRVIHAQYPPGSSFKTVTSIAAMRAGVFDPNWVYHAPGYIDIGNIHIVFLDEKGDVSYLEAFTHSWNTYFMTLGMKVGRDILIDTAKSLNLGSPTGIILKGELPGLIPDPEFVKRVHGRDMGNGDVANTAIGQGDVLVTPLQMADLMAAVANGGTVYKPRLVKQVEDRNGNVMVSFPTQTDRTGVFEGAWTQWLPNLKAAMINVIDEIAAKTGTAQVGSKTQPRQIAWLSGYIPADNPQYSFSIMVEGQLSDNHGFGLDDGLLGGVDAGSIAKDIFDQIYPPPGQKGKDGAQTVANDSTGKATASSTSGADTSGGAASGTTATTAGGNLTTP
jgi:penicillin-binding protein 2